MRWWMVEENVWHGRERTIKENSTTYSMHSKTNRDTIFLSKAEPINSDCTLLLISLNFSLVY
jgi:hypothetical protein